jgi:hypothetical protein
MGDAGFEPATPTKDFIGYSRMYYV